MVAKKRKSSKTVAVYNERLAEMAKRLAKNESSALSQGSFLRLAGGQFAYKGDVIKDASINVCVLDFCFENIYFDGDYDPNNPAMPACYAVGREEDDLIPHKNVTNPQSSECSSCEFNEWGSSDTGRGKACKNTRRLALIMEDDLQDMDNAEVIYMNIPVTSIKNWAGYVDQLNRLKQLPPLAVVTSITIERDPEVQFRLEFHMEDEINDGAILESIFSLIEDKLTEGLLFGYSSVSDNQAKTGNKVTAKKGRGASKFKKNPPAKKAPAKKAPQKPVAKRKSPIKRK